jgi:acyl-CoA-binding protein
MPFPSYLLTSSILAVTALGWAYRRRARLQTSINAPEDLEGLSEAFEKAVAFVREHGAALDSETKLSLYALFKQATEGPCSLGPASPFDLAAWAKRRRWQSLGAMSCVEARTRYVLSSLQLGERSQKRHGRSFGVHRRSSLARHPTEALQVLCRAPSWTRHTVQSCLPRLDPLSWLSFEQATSRLSLSSLLLARIRMNVTARASLR